jgi:hypothetical protein
MTPSSNIDDEIARLMRDPNALNAEPSLTPNIDVYDNARTPLNAAQLAQLGPGNPAASPDQSNPFYGLFGGVTAGEHLVSQHGFNQTVRNNPHIPQLPIGRLFLTPTQVTSPENLPNGFRLTLRSTTYGYDPVTGAYVTIRASSARPVVIREIDGIVSIER